MSAARDRLVMALRTHPDLPVLHPGSDHIADALLPVVERIANERAAEALEQAANDWNAYDTGPAPKHVPTYLRARAAS